MRRIREIMATDVEVVRPETSVKDAAEKMRTLNIGVLPVVDNDRVVGVITDRDIVVRSIAEGRDPQRLQARQIMTEDVVSCQEDEFLHKAVEVMRDQRVGRLVVTTPDFRLRGLLSLGDIARGMGEERLAGFVYERVAPNRARRVLTGLGVLSGVATLIAGVRYFKGQERGTEGARAA